MGSLSMDWSATSATKAYLDTIKLCKHESHKRRSRDRSSTSTSNYRPEEPGSSEFVSALAAGMRAKLIVEVTPTASPSTIALAAAARHTGGRLVCILPEEEDLAESKRVILDSGLKDLVEFETGDPAELLARHSNVDFSLVNCGSRGEEDGDEGYERLLGSIDVNPRRSVVVARDFNQRNSSNNNKLGLGLGLGMLGFGVGLFKRALDKKRVAVRSVKNYPMGKGLMQVITMIEKNSNSNNHLDDSSSFGARKDRITRSTSLRSNYYMKKSNSSTKGKSKWVAKFDEKSGEEHIFRVPARSNSCNFSL